MNPNSYRIRRIAMFSLIMIAVVGLVYFLYKSNRQISPVSPYQANGLHIAPPTYQPLIFKGNRILVIAPHPDDETVGAGSAILLALSHHFSVTVVVITNGDSYMRSAKRLFHKRYIEPLDMRKYGAIRSSETIKACSILGLQRHHVIFLGFPDKGLAALWGIKFPLFVYHNKYTRTDQTYGKDAWTKGQPYTHLSVSHDLQYLIQTLHPTDIFFPLQMDKNKDHAATSQFVMDALKRTSSLARYHQYLVHYGKAYPNGQWGLNSQRSLIIPSSLQNETMKQGVWEYAYLSKPQVQKLSKAVMQYHSQLLVTPKYLHSFIAKYTPYFTPVFSSKNAK